MKTEEPVYANPIFKDRPGRYDDPVCQAMAIEADAMAKKILEPYIEKMRGQRETRIASRKN